MRIIPPHLTIRLFLLGLLSLAILLGVSTALLAEEASPVDHTLFFDGFEHGITPYDQSDHSWKPVGLGAATTVVTNPVRSGQQAAQFTLRYDDDWNHPASELRLNQPRIVNTFDIGSERWYSFSIFLPEDYENQAQPNILNQFHAVPDKHLGETWRNPPISLGTEGAQWRFKVNADSNPVTVKGDYDVLRHWHLGTWEPGVWTDWVFHIRWSYEADGFIYVWKNGELALAYHGPNTFNDDVGPFWKIGIYEFYWNEGPSNVAERVIYYDTVRVGDQDATLAEMMPGAPPPATPTGSAGTQTPPPSTTATATVTATATAVSTSTPPPTTPTVTTTPAASNPRATPITPPPPTQTISTPTP